MSSKQRRKRPRKQEAETKEDAAAWKELSADVQRDIRSVVSAVLQERSDDDDGSSIETGKLLKEWEKHAAAAAAVKLAPLNKGDRVVHGALQAELYLSRCIRRSEQVSRVFALLDTDGKGCVVANDILRVAHALGGEDAALTEEEAVEMVEEFAAADADGLLSLEDMAQIAAKVNL